MLLGTFLRAAADNPRFRKLSLEYVCIYNYRTCDINADIIKSVLKEAGTYQRSRSLTIR